MTSTAAVVVQLPAALAEHAEGQRSLSVQLGDAETVGDVLDALTEGRPQLAWRIRDETGALRRHVNVYVGTEDVRGATGLATPIADGDVVTVLPSVAGG
ncbi:MAG TPA: ubiquitin-like small modifier protein 1 [Acidothermales bacterium]|nr:ubiquitin-like small modifier protein 1 [Actinomycetes bacterium]